MFFFFQAEDGIRDKLVTGVQTCALPISDQNDLPRRALEPVREDRSDRIDLGLSAPFFCGDSLSASRRSTGHRAQAHAHIQRRGAGREPCIDFGRRGPLVVKRVIVGAHYGLKDWLAQRITAIVLVVYTLLWLPLR